LDVTRLGEILLARGVVSPDALRSALEACRRHGGRLGTWLLRLGLVNEATLLAALAEQTGRPPAPTLELATAPAEVRGLIPAPLAKRNLMVAFAREGRSLSVAMLHPNDLMAIDEIASLTGLVVRPHVATETALAAALAIPLTQTGDAAGGRAPGPPRAAVREWRQFWRFESSHQELFHALETPASAPLGSAPATFPQLVPIGRELVQGGSTIEDLGESLASVRQRDQVATLVLDHLSTLTDRVALFSLHQGKVMGWAVRGGESVDEDFHTLMLPLDRPSVFLNLVRGVDLHVGPLGGGEGNQVLLDALGPPTPVDAVIAPIRVRGKPASFVWLDNGERSATGAAVDHVQRVARCAGLALEILVLQQKIRTAGHLTEPVIAD
jgi:hypothetical protein